MQYTFNQTHVCYPPTNKIEVKTEECGDVAVAFRDDRQVTFITLNRAAAVMFVKQLAEVVK